MRSMSAAFSWLCASSLVLIVTHSNLAIPLRVRESMLLPCALMMLIAVLGEMGWIGGYGSGVNV